MPTQISNKHSSTVENTQVSLKRLLLSESLKQMNPFPSSSLTSDSFGQSAFESFLIDEYSKSLAASMKFDFKGGAKK